MWLVGLEGYRWSQLGYRYRGVMADILSSNVPKCTIANNRQQLHDGLDGGSC